MPTVVHHFDPWLEIGSISFLCEDFDAAIDCALEAEDWVHQTSDTDITHCETILMWDEETSTFYLYIDLRNLGFAEGNVQIDTFVYSE